MNVFSRRVLAGKGMAGGSSRSIVGSLGFLLFSAYPAYGQWITDSTVCKVDGNGIHAPRPVV